MLLGLVVQGRFLIARRRSIPQDQKHVNKGARNWTPIETNQFCLISADSVSQFMIILERKALKKSLLK